MPPKKNNKKKNNNNNNSKGGNGADNNTGKAAAVSSSGEVFEAVSESNNTGVAGAENFGISYDSEGEIQVSKLYLATLAKNTANSLFVSKKYIQACQGRLQIL